MFPPQLVYQRNCRVDLHMSIIIEEPAKLNRRAGKENADSGLTHNSIRRKNRPFVPLRNALRSSIFIKIIIIFLFWLSSCAKEWFYWIGPTRNISLWNAIFHGVWLVLSPLKISKWTIGHRMVKLVTIKLKK